MPFRSQSIRKLFEVGLILGVGVCLVRVALAHFAPGPVDAARAATAGLLLAMLTAPALYWRLSVAPSHVRHGEDGLWMVAAAQCVGLLLTAAALDWQKCGIEQPFGLALAACVDHSGAVVAGIGGVAATLLLTLAIWVLSAAKSKAEARARRMRTDLDRFARVARHTSNAVTMLDAQSRILWVNEGFVRITGYALDEAVGRTPAELLGSGEADPAVLDRLARAGAAGDDCRVEVPNRRKNGEVYWVDTEVKVIRDPGGAVTGFMEMGSDITEHKRLQVALQAALGEADALLRAIDNHSIVSIADRDGRIVHANDAFCSISGYEREDLLGRTHAIVNSGAHGAGFFQDMWRTIASGQSWRGAICNRAKDGSFYWVDSLIAPVTGVGGRIDKYISIRNDITKSRLAQQELRDVTDRLGAAIEGSSDGIWDWTDMGSDQRWFSPSCFAMLGYAPGELPSNVATFHELMHPDFADAWRQGIERALAGGVPLEIEYMLRHKSGEYRWVRTRAKVYRDSEGCPVRMAGSLQDIHERRVAQDELLRERARLGRIIEGTNVGTWEWDIETGEVQVNERWAAIVGSSLARLGTVTVHVWQSHFHPDDLSRSSRLLQQHFDGVLPYYECELRMRHVKGHWVWVLDRGKLFERDPLGRPVRMAGTRTDITRRKAIEDALRESQAFLDRTGRVGGVGGWQLDLRTGTVTWSRQTYRIHEVEPSYVPTLEGALDFYPPHARRELRAALALGQATGTPWDLEVPFVTARGRETWVRAIGEVEYENGFAARLIGALQDVTERRALEERLRRGNDLLTGVVENLPCGVVVVDDDFQVDLHNAKFRQVMNVDESFMLRPALNYREILAMWAHRGDLGEGEHQARIEEAMALIPRGQAGRLERPRPNGVVIEVVCAPMPKGGIIATFTDISERKRAEANAIRSEALLRGAMDAVNEAFVVFDADDRLVLCNDKYRAIADPDGGVIVPGVTFEELIRAGVAGGHSPEAAGRVDDWVAERVAIHRSGQGSLVEQLGDGRWLRVAERRMPDGHVVGLRIDITDLMLAKQAAEAASRAKSQFLANVSHEIRTPMNGVLGMLTLLQRTGLAPEQRDYAAKAEGAARSLLGLLNDVLDFSKAEAGKMLIDPRVFGLRSLFQDLLDLMRANLGDKPVALRVEIDAAVPDRVIGDDLRLRQVLVNLGSNAIKFTSVGEVVLRVRLQRLDAEIVALRFSVEDSGVGISPEQRGAIFEGFTQAEASITRRFGGTGLGLAISQHLVTLMGGHIEVDSELGRGSVFSFALQLRLARPGEAENARERVEQARHGDRLSGLRLLVVEDNLLNQQIARELLEAEGASVVLVDNGRVGVEAVHAAAIRFDAVLMDLQMPEMDGFAATAELRRGFDSDQLPIIAMSANAMASDREACAAAGMNDHVGKPYAIDGLVATLLRHVKRAAVGAYRCAPRSFQLPSALSALAGDAGIELDAALDRMGGRVDVYTQSLASFLPELDSLGRRLGPCLDAVERARGARLMHTTRGLAAALGLARLASVMETVETLLARSTLDPAASAALASAVELASAGIGRLLPRLRESLGPASQCAVGRAAPPLAAIESLLTALSRADMRACDLLGELRAAHACLPEPDWDRLQDAVDALDFERAIAVCRALASRGATVAQRDIGSQEQVH